MLQPASRVLEQAMVAQEKGSIGAEDAQGRQDCAGRGRRDAVIRETLCTCQEAQVNLLGTPLKLHRCTRMPLECRSELQLCIHRCLSFKQQTAA
jgi:hypothetical protein